MRVRTAKDELAGTKRYETFVIRLWVEEKGLVEHGEIHHIGSNSTVRFRKIARALTFIRDIIGLHDARG